jgi:carbonic anhydrase
MAEGKFATSITCMDGRIQVPIIEWIKENYDVDFIDTITEPGVDKKISDASVFESIKVKAAISINAHKSNMIFVSGHYDCAGNPVSDDEHKSHIKKGVEMIKQWNPKILVVGLWINGNWVVEKIK